MGRHNPSAPAISTTMGGPGLFPGLLVDEGHLNHHALRCAEQHARRERMELVDAVVSLGLLPEIDAYRALAKATSYELVDLEAIRPSELAIRLVPERVARRHAVVPVQVDNRTLVYATHKPFDDEAARDLTFASGRRATSVLALRSSVLQALERAYPRVGQLDTLADKVGEQHADTAEKVTEEAPAESTVIELCNNLIARAVEVGASDIHIDFTNVGATVRYRICGVLEPVLTLPPGASHPVRNRFKIMAKADIAVRLKPQDGSFRVSVNGRVIDVRLSSLPSVHGEKLVMRVIDSQSPLQGIDHLGYDDPTMTRLKRALNRPDGLVLVTGPTGSGKTTALYAALGHLCTGHTNIVSVEDPVERIIPGVTQIAVNNRAGNTFAAILKSLLRQDPNTIMVGEVRDAEVAQIVGQAAYTGHLVLSSLHTQDAASAITRLMNLGLEPFKIAESLTAVLAQRLVRTLCPECRKLHSADEARQLGERYNVPAVPASAGPGCEQCKQTGYNGRVPVAELLTPSEQLRATIARGATAREIRTAMRADGMPTMRDRGLDLVVGGFTSIEELDRVLADDGAARNQHPTERVLVCDDDPITRMLVKLLLEREPFEVLEAASGTQASDIAVRERPDLVLIDLNMPGGDGYDAIAKMRADSSLGPVPILVLTSEDGPGIERRVLDLGADDYMLKPFDPTVLTSRVRAAFRRAKAAAV